MGHQADRAKRTVAKMIGQKFGRLTVVRHHSAITGYECRCECGDVTIARTYSLKTGRHQSCGCQPRRTRGDHAAAKNSILKGYRAAAKRRGYSFELTPDEFFGIIGQACHYCGCLPSLKSHLKRHESFRYSGVDRVDNTVGYTLSNCVPCCDICNNSKSTLTLEVWRAWVARLYSKQYSGGK